MRRDLVEAVLDAASPALFDDVLYAPIGGVQVHIVEAISGVEVVDENFEMFGQAIRRPTHVTRALKAKFPDLQPGDTINDGEAYEVLDHVPIGDGRFEILISLRKI